MSEGTERRRRAAFALALAAVASTSFLLGWAKHGGVGSLSSPRSDDGDVADVEIGRRRLGTRLAKFKDPKSTSPRSRGSSSFSFPAKRKWHAGGPKRTVHLLSRGGVSSPVGEAMGSAVTPDSFSNEMGELKPPPSEKDLPSLKEKAGCVPSKAWHAFTPLNCNAFHEIDAGMRHKEDGNYIKFLDHGGRRDAWVYERAEGGGDRVILKTLRWDKPYGERFFDNQRKDALVSERLSPSPHVIDAYGFCGMSTFNEFAGGGNFETYIERNKGLDSEDILVFARNISIGLADVHEIGTGRRDEGDVPGMPVDAGTVVHHDFRHHNLLLTDDLRVKLSDFNTAQLMQWNTQEDESCGFGWFKHCGLTIWGADRSPEECAGDRQNVVTQKAEAFHLGALLHFLLSKRPHPYVERIFWEDDERRYVLEQGLEGAGEGFKERDMAERVRRFILDGVDAPLPKEVVESDDPAVKAILKARGETMAYDVDKRATARRAAEILVKAAAEMGVMKEPPKRGKVSDFFVAQDDANGKAFADPDSAPVEVATAPKSAAPAKGEIPPFPQNERGVHPLEFVHTATTGGSNIELSASRLGIAWGVCKYERTWEKDSRCNSILPFRESNKIKALDGSADWKCTNSLPWHCPPADFRSGRNNYDGVDTFTIVQDPYSRMIAEYYTFVKKKSILEEKGVRVEDPDDGDFMNRIIVDLADDAIEEGMCYFGHCIPMHEYVYKDGKRMVTHVLKVENLEEEFADLMKKYGLPMKLEDAKMRKEGALGVEDLSDEAIEKINEWGKLDFEYFGYDMRGSTGKNNARKGSDGGSVAVAADAAGDVAPFPQNERGLHRLEFVHIAKTGGTSIELAASRVGIAWGICKFEEYWSWESRCKPILPYRQHIQIQQLDDWKCGQKAWAWHCPPFNYEAQRGVNKFEGVETFTVVRNPYSLMVSEYYYLFQKKPHLVQDTIDNMKEGELNDPEFMNRWMVETAQKAIDKGFCYFAHCIAQHNFAYRDGERFVDHVLKMEELDDEFPKLMEKYGMPVRLEHTNSRKGGTNLGVEDLSREAIEKINEWAGPDFEYFGYEKLDPSKAAAAAPSDREDSAFACLPREDAAASRPKHLSPLVIFGEPRVGSNLFFNMMRERNILAARNSGGHPYDVEIMGLYDFFHGTAEKDQMQANKVLKKVQRDCRSESGGNITSLPAKLEAALDSKYDDPGVMFDALDGLPSYAEKGYYTFKIFSEKIKNFLKGGDPSTLVRAASNRKYADAAPAKYIVMWRRRMIESFVSEELAIKTGARTSRSKHYLGEEAPKINVRQSKLEEYIDTQRKYYESVKRALKDAGVTEYLVLEYGRDLLTTEQHLATVRRLESFLGAGGGSLAEATVARLGHEKQQKGDISTAVENWDEVVRLGRGGELEEWEDLFESHENPDP